MVVKDTPICCIFSQLNIDEFVRSVSNISKSGEDATVAAATTTTTGRSSL